MDHTNELILTPLLLVEELSDILFSFYLAGVG
jgi:hypothetical protein